MIVKITFNNKETDYTVLVTGDINGDGKVNILDAVLLLNAIKGTKTLDGEFKEAACLKNDNSYNVLDAVYMLNYIKGSSSISLVENNETAEDNKTEDKKTENKETSENVVNEN